MSKPTPTNRKESMKKWIISYCFSIVIIAAIYFGIFHFENGRGTPHDYWYADGYWVVGNYQIKIKIAKNVLLE